MDGRHTAKSGFIDSILSEYGRISFSYVENIFSSERACNSVGSMIFMYCSGLSEEQRLENIEQLSDLSDEDFKKFEKIVNNENFKNICERGMFNSINEVMRLSELPYDNLNDILSAIAEDYSNSLYYELPDKSVTDVIINCYNLINGARINKNDNIQATKLQYDAGDMLTIIKNTFSKDKTDKSTTLQHSTIATKNDDKVIRSKVEKAGNESTSWNIGGDRVVILNRNTNKQDIDSQFEIVKNQKGEPFCIVHTKESELLKGVYDSTTYYLEGFNEEADIIDAIKNGTIEKEIKEGYKKDDVIVETSKVSKSNDDTITYLDKNECNGTKSERKYVQKPDGSYEYSYNIKDKDDNPIFSMDRSFIKSPDGKSTKTIINGKEYITTFDDENMTATVVDYNGETTTIDIKNKLTKLYQDETSKLTEDDLKGLDVSERLDKMLKANKYSKEELEYIEKTYGNEENMQRAFFNFIKTMPAEHLLFINSDISEISIVGPINSCHDRNGTLEIGMDIPIVSHELGHAKDYKGQKSDFIEIVMNTESHKGNISGDEKLIDIYNEEMELFKEKYSVDLQEVIKYFGQNGGGASDTGLAELIAETNMLMTTCGNNADFIKTRSQYLVRYFPKTVAKIGELLGYNAA